MKHFEVLKRWCKKMEMGLFGKRLISLDHVTYFEIVTFITYKNIGSQQIAKLNVFYRT